MDTTLPRLTLAAPAEPAQGSVVLTTRYGGHAWQRGPSGWRATRSGLGGVTWLELLDKVGGTVLLAYDAGAQQGDVAGPVDVAPVAETDGPYVPIRWDRDGDPWVEFPPGHWRDLHSERTAKSREDVELRYGPLKAEPPAVAR